MTIQTGDSSAPLINEKVERLESSVNALLSLCEKLFEENQMYRNNNNQLKLERSELQTKNDKVRVQVEAMVERLKSQDKAS